MGEALMTATAINGALSSGGESENLTKSGTETAFAPPAHSR
jgi:hypothetical protein